MTTATDRDDLLDGFVDAVLELVNLPDDDPGRDDVELRLIALCEVALGSPSTSEPVRLASGDLTPRIVALAAEGKGVREIARELSVAPSTVSRRLRKAPTLDS